MRSLNKNQGVSLVAAIAIMVLASILGLVLASMLGITSRGVVDYERSSQAFGLAQAGVNWYMMSLAGITDWDTATNQTGITLGPGTFDVTVSNQAKPLSDATEATRMDIAVTGKVIGTAGTTIQRTMSQRILKLPSAAKFALFWGRRTGMTLNLTSTTISGDFWSQGSASLPNNSVTNGTVYYPSTESITGTGFNKKAIIYPYFPGFSGASATFSTPAMNTTYYTDLVSVYDTALNNCTGPSTQNQNTDLVLNGDTLCYRYFYAVTNNNTTVTISGNGTIIATRDIGLNSTSGTNRRLIISPSGGNIVFLANRSITVNDVSGSNVVTASSGTRMYSRGFDLSSYLLTINNNNTNIDGALLLAGRRIIVQNGADITNSILFVNYPAGLSNPSTNNYLQVTGAGTSIGTLAGGPCSLISIGRANGTPSALTVDTSASVVGLLYQYDGVNTGSTRLNSATITGSVIANQFQGNAIASSTITYDPSALPDPPPEGFDGFATKKPNSWSGN